MMSKLRYIVAAAALALAPISASATTTDYAFQDPLSGSVWNFSDGTSKTFQFAPKYGTEGGQYIVNIYNDLADTLRYQVAVLETTFEQLSITEGASPLKGAWSILTVNYTADDALRGIYFTLEAVPLPAAALLMLTALGGLAVSRRRTGAAEKPAA